MDVAQRAGAVAGGDEGRFRISLAVADPEGEKGDTVMDGLGAARGTVLEFTSPTD